MAIVKMKKISILGLSSMRETLMEMLMDLGVIEFNRQEEKLADETWAALFSQDGNESEVARLESRISKVSLALETISRYETARGPLFKTRRPMSREHFHQVLSEEEIIWNHVDRVLSLYQELSSLKSEENQIKANQLSLEPWADYAVPLSIQGTKYASILIGSISNGVDLKEIREEIEEQTLSYEINLLSSDIEQHYFYVLCLKKEQEKVLEILLSYGFNRMTFKEIKGTPRESLTDYEAQLLEIAKKREAIEEKAREAVQWKQAVECLNDHLILCRDKEKIRSRLLKSKSAFYMDGWLPEESIPAVEAALKEMDCYYELAEAEPGEEPPILLQNGKFAEPFEAITGMYGMPSDSAVDPTPFLAPFYCLFFGIMLGDAGYGLVMTLGTFFVSKKYPLEGTTGKMMRMFFYCGISTVFWGAMFGSWFGNLVPSVASVFFDKSVPLPPIWFDPVTEPMGLLFFSFLLGALHLIVGLGLQAYIFIKNGRILDAICDIGFWYVVFVGIALLILQGNSEIGKWVIMTGAAGLLLTGGRAKKNIFGKLMGGFSSLYNIVKYFSDVLSYSRLLAMGLSSAVIAQVINTMGLMAGGGLIGVILMTVVGIFGHSFNIAINALGAFVHSCRLQYVEFFGKFFGKEGTAFDPFDKKTKYILVKEEN